MLLLTHVRDAHGWGHNFRIVCGIQGYPKTYGLVDHLKKHVYRCRRSYIEFIDAQHHSHNADCGHGNANSGDTATVLPFDSEDAHGSDVSDVSHDVSSADIHAVRYAAVLLLWWGTPRDLSSGSQEVVRGTLGLNPELRSQRKHVCDMLGQVQVLLIVDRAFRQLLSLRHSVAKLKELSLPEELGRRGNMPPKFSQVLRSFSCCAGDL
ncbi:hypothetical protein MTO96_024502 [Rhipicephalus appendiculatus]